MPDRKKSRKKAPINPNAKLDPSQVNDQRTKKKGWTSLDRLNALKRRRVRVSRA